ncbi:MAG: hypothetical protein MR283_06650 [Erysipelotrichaceae bacterium]|nr:hypothetical protein [Erysipelotrichaceae bacterium]
MKLDLFTFIDETMNYYNSKSAVYQYAEGKLYQFFSQALISEGGYVISLSSRVKAQDSLKEKLIRNHFYLKYRAGQDAIDHLSDLIGISAQCRFIRNEDQLYKSLFQMFKKEKGSAYYVAVDNPDIYLDLDVFQPQLQRNGFTIYRIDGFYIFNDEKIHFEFQIKSLVHSFWSEIEHEVVYKNPDFVIYDQFDRNMLGAIRDNLDVVDRQLEIMYEEISQQSKHAQIGMDEIGFKQFVARSINELVNRKMRESVGFTSDFKKCSAMIAQFVYVRDFINGEHNRERMMDYLETLNMLARSDLDLSEEIVLDRPYETDDQFCLLLGKYWQTKLNSDFQWHIFFAMLFSIQPGSNLDDFTNFLIIIKRLFIEPNWYQGTFANFKKQQAKKIQTDLELVFAQTLIDVDDIEIVHEDKVYTCMITFKHYIEELEKNYTSYESFMQDFENIKLELSRSIGNHFH